MKRKTICYIIEMNSSIGSLIERLHDLGAETYAIYVGHGNMELTVIMREDKMVEVENEMAFYI